MTTEEETIVFDALKLLQGIERTFTYALNQFGTAEQKQAYRDGVSGPVIKLQVLLGEDGIKRGLARYKKLQEIAEAYFAQQQL